MSTSKTSGDAAGAAGLLVIGNRGQAIANTNFFDSEHARKGLFYLSWNAGAGRLLVPDCQKHLVSEMRTAKYVIISRGPWIEQGDIDALEMLFEDHSDSPFVLMMSHAQCDRLLPVKDQGVGFFINVWTRGGQKLRLPGRYREVTALPCMDEWAIH